MIPSDAEFGCGAFGHLASPFVDGELPRDDQDRFAIHLDACRPCRQVVAAYRALDVLARSPVPTVSEAEWERAWGAVRSGIALDRDSEQHAPMASVARLGARIGAGRRPRWLLPVGYAAAAGLLVALTLSLQRRWDRPGPGDRGGVANALLRPTASGPMPTRDPARTSLPMSISCLAPDFMPVVYTIDGENPMTVVQCAWIGADLASGLPTEG